MSSTSSSDTIHILFQFHIIQQQQQQQSSLSRDSKLNINILNKQLNKLDKQLNKLDLNKKFNELTQTSYKIEVTDLTNQNVTQQSTSCVEVDGSNNCYITFLKSIEVGSNSVIDVRLKKKDAITRADVAVYSQRVAVEQYVTDGTLFISKIDLINQAYFSPGWSIVEPDFSSGNSHDSVVLRDHYPPLYGVFPLAKSNFRNYTNIDSQNSGPTPKLVPGQTTINARGLPVVVEKTVESSLTLPLAHTTLSHLCQENLTSLYQQIHLKQVNLQFEQIKIYSQYTMYLSLVPTIRSNSVPNSNDVIFQRPLSEVQQLGSISFSTFKESIDIRLLDESGIILDLQTVYFDISVGNRAMAPPTNSGQNSHKLDLLGLGPASSLQASESSSPLNTNSTTRNLELKVNGTVVGVVLVRLSVETKKLSDYFGVVSPPSPGVNNEVTKYINSISKISSDKYLLDQLNHYHNSLLELTQLAVEYRMAITSHANPNPDPYKSRDIKCFRPSTSKKEKCLASIPVNLHIQSLKFNDDSMIGVTCGVPADHSLGYDHGGLHQIEGRMASIPSNPSNINTLLFFSMHKSLRLTRVIPQFVCQVVTSYLCSLSDVQRVKQFLPFWLNYGYICCYEGLLSTAGKEGGMIQDVFYLVRNIKLYASIVPETEMNNSYTSSSHSICTGVYCMKHADGLLLNIALSSKYYSYYNFLHGKIVKLIPLLFQCGVDIQQFGANTLHGLNKNINNVKKDVHGKMRGSLMAMMNKNPIPGMMGKNESLESSNHSSLDEESSLKDEKSNPALLKEINLYSYQILNSYCISAFPQIPSNDNGAHPFAQELFQWVHNQNDEVKHDGLMCAVRLAESCGAGSVIFCKSGKDRTGMQVTFKEAMFIHSKMQGLPEETLFNLKELTSFLRQHGTRALICEKNVGSPKYAFNTLQVKFMPEVLRPPLDCIAGVLKGGSVFTGQGFIES